DLMPDKLNTIVELGAGEGQKSEIILKEAFSRDNEIQFVPVDISQNSIDTLVHRLHLSLPDLRINSFHGDYFDYLSGKSANFQGRRLFLLLGANIGNLNPKEGMEFLRQIGSYMAKDECLVVGFDLKKEISIMDKAYNDNKG